jgi:glycosyltransferase involved in cell wall biosynthesis
MSWLIAGPVYPYRGGIAHFTTALVQAAQTRGDVHVLSFSRLYPALLFPGTSTQDPSAAPRKVPVWALVDSLNPLSWWMALKKIRKVRPELVVLQWWTTFLAPCFGITAYWLRRWGIPVVFIIHNVLPHEPRVMDRWLARAVLRNASGYLVMAAREFQRLTEILPQAAGKTVIHQHPVYVHIPRSTISKETARQQLDIPQVWPILLSFGFVRRYKGILHLLQSVAQLKQDGNPVFLLVAGEIWHDEARYSAELDRLNIRDYVRFDNRYIPDEEVPFYFAAADIFVAPYLEGTQSGSVRLAMNQGLPIVVSEHLADGQAMPVGRVMTFPAGDVAALSRSILEQLSSNSSGESANQDPRPGETWDDLIQALSKLHKRISKST